MKPVYVSVGHLVDLDSALEWVTKCCRGYRLPEPTRLAHLAAAGRLMLEPEDRRSVSDHSEIAAPRQVEACKGMEEG